MIFEKFYSVWLSWTSENLNLSHFFHKSWRSYKMIYDPGEAMKNFVKQLNLTYGLGG